MRDAERRSQAMAKRLRRQMTNAEVILWSRLRHNAAHGQRFRRQHPVGPYIADFACVPARLIVEVDGETHSTLAELAHDRRRDAYLRTRGWRVFRITNKDVYENLDSVLEGIVRFLPPPRP
jgi:very-short-patch-repair endonuclease